MKNVKQFFILCTSAVVLSSCGGQSKIFESVTLTTSQIQNNLWVKAEAVVNTGALPFVAVTIPVVNPHNPSEILGKISMLRSVDQKNILQLEADLTLLTNLQLQNGATLPNGSPLPIAGLNMAGIPISSHSQFYVGAQNGILVLGTAVAIPAFDQIGRYVPGVNLFWDIPASPQVSAIGGAFTGPLSGQNGLALFLKFSQGSSTKLSRLAVNEKLGTESEIKLLSNDKQVNSRVQMKLAQQFLLLEQKQIRLRAH